MQWLFRIQTLNLSCKLSKLKSSTSCRCGCLFPHIPCWKIPSITKLMCSMFRVGRGPSMPVVTGRTSSGNGTERTAGHWPPLFPTDCNTKSKTKHLQLWNWKIEHWANAILLFSVMHLADAFIQSDLHYIQGTHFISSCIPWESNPWTWHC